jgi:hypothetical protein
MVSMPGSNDAGAKPSLSCRALDAHRSAGARAVGGVRFQPGGRSGAVVDARERPGELERAAIVHEHVAQA